MHIIRIIVIFFLVFAAAQGLRAEYVFLKDGSIHQGKILKDTADIVTMQMKNGKVKDFYRAKIIRILYTDIYMGKHLIRLNTGETLEAYQVDEDTETYTFRRDIKKPEEFVVKRSNVLFMTRTNPTGLAGRPNLSEIRLTWLAPYQAPRRYRVYVKENKGDQYRLAGDTIYRSYMVKGLATRKTYFFIVTAIASDGAESVPSNEIQMRTNLPPLPPASGSYSIAKKPKNVADVKLTWKPGSDPDGTVTGYRVYQRRNYDTDKVADGPTTGALVRDVPLDLDNHFMIRTVDDDGIESENRTVSILLRRMNISARLGCILPVGDFADLMNPGVAVTVSAALSNFGVNYLCVGLDLGYMWMSCKMDDSYVLHMVPIAATLAYQFEITPLFSLVPKISAGIVCLQSEIVHADEYTGYAPAKGPSVEALVGAELSARFQVSELLSVGINASYGLIAETDPSQYITLMADLTFRFKI